MFSAKRAIYKLGRIIDRAIPCSQGINGSGGAGVYYLDLNVGTDVGLTGIRYDAQGVPDWFRIYWDGNLVANSKYVGDNITQTNPTGGVVAGTYNLAEYNYVGSSFVPSGTTTNVVVNSSDISNRTSEASDGNGYLLFNKTAAQPSTIRIVVVGSPTSSTSWSLAGVCPTPQTITGKVGVYYGFLTEANKTVTTGKTMRFLVVGNNFYTNEVGGQDFSLYYGWTSTNAYVNDGTTWYQLDATGSIISQGVI